MSDPADDDPHVLGGLLHELAAGLSAPAAAPSPTLQFPQAKATPARRSAIIDASVATGPPHSAAALLQAERILRATGPSPAPVWRLVHQGQTLVLGEGDVIGIGRRPGPGIRVVVADPIVSKVHCRAYLHSGVIVVEDLGSMNGTRVRRGGTSFDVVGAVELADGDELSVRDEVSLGRVQRAGV